jgi:hypothetical protein
MWQALVAVPKDGAVRVDEHRLVLAILFLLVRRVGEVTSKARFAAERGSTRPRGS